MDTKKRKTFYKAQKDYPLRKSPQEFHQCVWGGWSVSSGVLSRGTDAASEHVSEVPAMGWDEPIVRNLPEII
jgi:hypothetical protein